MKFVKSAFAISRLATRSNLPVGFAVKSPRVCSIRCHNQLTQHVKNYNKINDQHIEKFKKILGESAVKTEDLEAFNIDWLKIHQGNQTNQ